MNEGLDNSAQTESASGFWASLMRSTGLLALTVILLTLLTLAVPVVLALGLIGCFLSAVSTLITTTTPSPPASSLIGGDSPKRISWSAPTSTTSAGSSTRAASTTKGYHSSMSQPPHHGASGLGYVSTELVGGPHDGEFVTWNPGESPTPFLAMPETHSTEYQLVARYEYDGSSLYSFVGQGMSVWVERPRDGGWFKS